MSSVAFAPFSDARPAKKSHIILPMTLWELIQQTRERYVGAYRQVLQQQRARVADLAAELTMRTEAPPAVPIDFCVLRVDVVWREKPTPPAADAPASADSPSPPPTTAPAPGPPQVAAVSLGPAAPLPTPLVTEYPDGQMVVVHSLAWEDCVFAITPPPGTAQTDSTDSPSAEPATSAAISPSADAALIAWLRRWRDRTDAPNTPPDADGLNSAVHSLSPPQLHQNWVTFAVDFGSAPPEAFTALISTLLAQGARTIQVGVPKATKTVV